MDAETVAQLAALQAEVAELRDQLARLFTAEAIIRRAGLPDPVAEIVQRRTRPRHLRAV